MSCTIGPIAFIAACFLIGSIPFGVVLARAFGLPDPRTIGSRNIGATNMLRTGRKDIAALTLLLDGAKGAVAVWMTSAIFHESVFTASVAIVLAVLGHMFSPWLKFKGGKGVATAIGGLFALSPMIGAMTCVIWLMVFVISGISSLSAIVAFIVMPLIAHSIMDRDTTIVLALMAALVLSRHKVNIQRLLKGEEPKFFGKKGKKS